MANQQVMEKKDFTPEQLELFRDLLENANEAYDRTFIPLTLISREKVIFYLKRAKDDIEKLQRIL